MENRYYLIGGILVFVAVAISGCTSPGSGSNGNQTADVQGVTNIALTGPGTLIIEQGDNESFSVNASDSQKSNIDISKSGNVLTITNRNSGGNDAVKFHLTVKSLESLTVTGAGEINATKINTSTLTITANDGSMSLAGKVNTLTATINGPGTINGKNLEVQIASITVNGAGKATLDVVEKLQAVINGAGSVTYFGNPQVEKQLNGQGTVTPG